MHDDLDPDTRRAFEGLINGVLLSAVFWLLILWIVLWRYTHLANQFPWGTLIAGISLIIIVGAGMASIYAQNTQALRDLENIQMRILPALQAGQNETHQRIDDEIFRARDADTELTARIAVMEGNIKRLIAYAESRTDSIEEMLLRIDPQLGAEYRRLRRQQQLVIEPPPIERRPDRQN